MNIASKSWVFFKKWTPVHRTIQVDVVFNPSVIIDEPYKGG